MYILLNLIPQNLNSLKNIAYIVAFLLLAILAESPLAGWVSQTADSYQIEQANESLANLQNIQKQTLNSGTIEFAFKQFSQPDYAEKGIFAFKYVDGKIQNWTNNQVALSTKANELFRLDKPIVKLADGWYVPASREVGDTLLLSLLLVQKEFPVNNTYLSHTANQYLSTQELIISDTEKDLIKGIRSKFPVAAIFSLLSWIGLAIAFVRGFKRYPISTLYSLIVIGGIVVLRFILLYLDFPKSIQSLPLFNPEFYAYSWWMPSLGQWAVNILLLVWAGNSLIALIEKEQVKLQSLKAILLFTWFLIVPMIFVWASQNMVVHSNLRLNVANLLQTTVFSWVAIAGLCLLGLFLFTASSNVFMLSGKSKIQVVFASIIASVFAYWQWQSVSVIIAIGVFNAGVLLYSEFQVRQFLGNFGTQMAVSGLVISLFLSITLYDFNANKESNEVNYLAGKLSSGRDLVQEYLYRKTAQRIAGDRKIKNHLAVFPTTSQKFSKELSTYFSGQWEGFDTHFFLFSPADSLVLKSEDAENTDINQIEEAISKSEPSSSTGLWLSTSEKAFRYISKTELGLGRGNENKAFKLYFIFSKQNSPGSLGYPDILLEKGISLRERLQGYSYSVIRDGNPIVQYENHSNGEEKSISWHYKSDDGRSEAFFSRPEMAWLSYINTFTVLFSFFFVLSLIAGLFQGSVSPKDLLSQGLRFRIVVATTGLLTFTLLAIGFASTRLMVRQFEDKSLDMAEEKLEGIKYRLQKIPNPLSESSIQDLSAAFHTDINLFNASGKLSATSRPAVFDEGFVSEMMQNQAYSFLRKNDNQVFSQKENIGELRFLSVYSPVNLGGNTYYLNVPFFARQGEIRAELSKMVSSLINIYFILVALSVVLTLLISGYITSPLETMAEKLAIIDLQNPQFIDWKSKDEIGKLVNSYNLMVGELAKNSAELARTEREMAWREMAKQVAHEIKNPLTPMKLQVQHLLMRYQSKSEGWEQQLEKTLPILEEQINSLADIATAFSNFAKMPQGNPEVFDLRTVIETTKHIYETAENLSIETDLPSTSLNIYADREQFMRVIQNLVKNGYQAIPAGRKGEIKIVARQDANQITLTISDNGTGIPDEIAAKVFTPNFTTKSSGMGLGLAIVRNIIEQWDGTIGFESRVGEGTVFRIVMKGVDGAVMNTHNFLP